MAFENVKKIAEADFPTRWGAFRILGFEGTLAEPRAIREQPAPAGAQPASQVESLVALVMGDVRNHQSVPVRVHSECLTSEVFGSLKCDCRDQLERAQAEIARRGFGAILYLRQEGRGIGLANKIRAYALQAMGADTIEANELLHLPVDARQYDVASAMLRELGVESVELMTNNPDKVEKLRALGIRVERRVPVLVAANPFSAYYLDVKRRRMQHEIPQNLVDSATTPEAVRSNLHVVSGQRAVR